MEYCLLCLVPHPVLIFAKEYQDHFTLYNHKMGYKVFLFVSVRVSHTKLSHWAINTFLIWASQCGDNEEYCRLDSIQRFREVPPSSGLKKCPRKEMENPQGKSWVYKWQSYFFKSMMCSIRVPIGKQITYVWMFV
jgi:hypothetical protein